jgi:hypothetical protein
VANDYYNRLNFIEMASFFFAFAGLGMALIEYELRYYLLNGEYREGEDPQNT